MNSPPQESGFDGFTTYTPRPGPQQPGTLRQQFAALDAYYSDQLSWIDPDAAWQAARINAMPHADPVYLFKDAR